jgi:catechol 2,3-dioxygenase-like lactoylglutathione lyase family enzyme
MPHVMKNICLVLLVAALAISASSQSKSQRPRITGIDHVAFYTTQPEGVKRLYADTLGLASADPIEPGEATRYLVGKQWVGYSPAPDPSAINRMDHIAFTTDDVAALRAYLLANGIKAQPIEDRFNKDRSNHSRSFRVQDPEGNRLEFVERDKSERDLAPPNSPVSHHIIHAGFLVHNRAAEDHFYRDLLGFRPYWHGGMNPNDTDWVSQQVPDGTDWLEYMLHQPEHPDQRTTGVLNHISLGVADMKKAQAQLEHNGWKQNDREKAQMGKDGKWQLNLFDPDLTRIELMEFKPVEKPCCSDFTAPHPTE